MILIAESGSTKTDWCLAKAANDQQSFSTGGLNPYFYDEEGVKAILEKDLPPDLPSEAIQEVYFYGAGASSEVRKERVRKGLIPFFPNANIHVDHDLMASARALCGDEAGIATILGTGSNTCVFDGREIVEQSGGIGFILGDEGSGADLGKRFLRAFFYGELPEVLHKAFVDQMKPDKDAIIDRVYQQPHPNQYLASYAEFINENRNHAFINDMVKSAFSEFVSRHVIKFAENYSLPVHSVGSIAYHFEPLLKEVFDSYGLTLGRIIVKPIASLVNYHIAHSDLKDDSNGQ